MVEGGHSGRAAGLVCGEAGVPGGREGPDRVVDQGVRQALHRRGTGRRARLKADVEGFLREALSSLYTFFGTTHEILRRYGPAIAPPLAPGHVSFGVLAVTVLNRVLRPLLASWHPRLTAYESRRPADIDPVAYERAWEHAEALRTEIAAVRATLVSLARTLQEVAGVGDLIDLVIVSGGRFNGRCRHRASRPSYGGGSHGLPCQ